MAHDMDSRLEPLARSLEASLEANLVSLTLYGSAARSPQHGRRSDVNLLLIVRDASTSALLKAAGPLAEWARRGEAAPLIFSEEEWKASADVFPIEIEDVRDAHRVVRGRDPVAGLATDRAHLRQQLEREVRGKLLHLRAEYAASAGDAKALTRLLENSVGTFLVLFRAALRLKGITPPVEPADLLQATSSALGLDQTPLQWALESRSGRAPTALKAFDPIAAQYVDAVERLARVVNGL